MVWRFYDTLSQGEIAERLGVSQMSVSRSSPVYSQVCVPKLCTNPCCRWRKIGHRPSRSAR
ncbi:sigma factor-like helix-turn-helix DNA-binding protein [Nocardia salmonicida]|uniref:sigma factor-like helix-turn-helix DNA-binding protein n=1 Tax=Nocardia salmonicida TaxID=53431 RepID=UPI003CEEAF9A